MSWNYRLMYHEFEGEEWYAIHEVFYNDDGKIIGWTKDPIEVVADNAEGVDQVLQMMSSDIHKYPVLSYDMEPEVSFVSFGVDRPEEIEE